MSIFPKPFNLDVEFPCHNVIKKEKNGGNISISFSIRPQFFTKQSNTEVKYQSITMFSTVETKGTCIRKGHVPRQWNEILVNTLFTQPAADFLPTCTLYTFHLQVNVFISFIFYLHEIISISLNSARVIKSK